MHMELFRVCELLRRHFWNQWNAKLWKSVFASRHTLLLWWGWYEMPTCVCVCAHMLFSFLFFMKVIETLASSSHSVMLMHWLQSYGIMQLTVFSVPHMFDQIICWAFALCCVCVCVKLYVCDSPCPSGALSMQTEIYREADIKQEINASGGGPCVPPPSIRCNRVVKLSEVLLSPCCSVTILLNPSSTLSLHSGAVQSWRCCCP